MKVAYIAHPISGDIPGNLHSIANINRLINLSEPDVVPFAPYYLDCIAMDDNNQEERDRGIKNDTALLRRGFIDEVRLYGNRISTGMSHEIELAHELGIPIVAMTWETEQQYKEMFGSTRNRDRSGNPASDSEADCNE